MRMKSELKSELKYTFEQTQAKTKFVLSLPQRRMCIDI